MGEAESAEAVDGKPRRAKRFLKDHAEGNFLLDLYRKLRGLSTKVNHRFFRTASSRTAVRGHSGAENGKVGECIHLHETGGGGGTMAVLPTRWVKNTTLTQPTEWPPQSAESSA